MIVFKDGVQVIPREWGHEKILVKTRDCVVKELYIEPNSSTPIIYHSVKGITLFLIDGKGYVEQKYKDIEEFPVYVEERLLLKSFPFHINVGQIHRLYTKDKGCVILEVSSPNLDDTVYIKDKETK